MAASPTGGAVSRTGVAIIGCGFVADFYSGTLPLHPELQLIGVFDKQAERAAKLAARHNVQAYSSLENCLADRRVELIINLRTRPVTILFRGLVSSQASMSTLKSHSPCALIMLKSWCDWLMSRGCTYPLHLVACLGRRRRGSRRL